MGLPTDGLANGLANAFYCTPTGLANVLVVDGNAEMQLPEWANLRVANAFPETMMYANVRFANAFPETMYAGRFYASNC